MKTFAQQIEVSNPKSGVEYFIKTNKWFKVLKIGWKKKGRDWFITVYGAER